MKGLIQVYTGDGKGKTTAAIGQAVRAAGAGKKVAFFQFFKGGKFPVSEEKILQGIGNIHYERFKETTPLFDRTINTQELALHAWADMEAVKEAIISEKYDMIILDEIIHVLNHGIMDENFFISMIKVAAAKTNFVLTGRGASKRLIKCADLVTEMKSVKHPFKKGIKAGRGIEF
jgi:cob(I)alamin adenosyltransferase